MFDEFNPCRKKRSVATRHGDDSFYLNSKCFVSGGGGGGSSGSTQSTATSYNTNIPEYAQPYVTSMLNATQQQLFNVKDGQVTGFAPYVPYSANPEDYVAGFTPMQTQAFQSAANLQTPGQFGAGSDLAAAAGQGALGTTGAAMGYGGMGAGYGQQGADIGVSQGMKYGGAGYAAGQAGQNIGTTQGLGYGAMGAGYGQAGAGTARQALGYGQGASDIGQQSVEAAQQGYGAGANYQRMATDPSSIQAYMNPYVQASLAPQLELMNQQLAQTQAQNQAQAVKQGAYGGSRQAVQQGLSQQNADLAKQQLIAQGYNTAFNQAQQAQQFGANLGIQGLGAGTQALQTGIAGQQAALQGVQGAQAGYGMGIQGAQAGLAGANTALAGTAQGIQGAQAGLAGTNAALAGTAQGMQGAQVGLQGVQGAQAGYGLANQAAGTLGQLGTQQLAAEQGIIGLQSQLGAQQQANQQQIINQAIQDYANAQQYPLMQLGTMSNMLRGLPLQSSTTQQYVAQPNATSQAIGTLGAGTSFYNAMKAKGGIIDADKYAEGGVVGSVESRLYDMDPEDLQKELKSPSPTIQKMARRIMAEKQVEGKAGGGIIAFADSTEDNNQSLVEEPAAPPQGIVQAAPQAPAPQPAPQVPAQKVAPIDTSVAGIKKLLGQGVAESKAQLDKPISDWSAEYMAALGPDVAAQERRKQLMEERANAGDESRRQNWMRAAEFFANWGSTPGNTLSAGLSAMKSIVPSVVSDQKEAKKYLRTIDDAMYDIAKSERLDKTKGVEYGALMRKQLGEKYYHELKDLSDISQQELRNAAASLGKSSEDQDAKKFDKAEKLTQNALKGNVEYQSIVAQAKTGGEPTADQLARIAQIEDSYRKFYYGNAGLPTGAEVNIPESPSAVKAKREKLEREIDKNTPTFDIMDNATKKKKREEAQRELDAMGGSSDNKERKPLSSFQK